METRELGRTGLRVSRIGLGGFPFGGLNRAPGWDPFTPEGRHTAIGMIRRALERGITYIDTAPSYGDGNSERIIGEALQGRRETVTLASKCPWAVDGVAVTRSIEASLGRLRTDHLDVIQFHGGMFTAEDITHILHSGPLEALPGPASKARCASSASPAKSRGRHAR
jgi:aryl-alcohol dehydrogenase-like predicted oxidoreductase